MFVICLLKLNLTEKLMTFPKGILGKKPGFLVHADHEATVICGHGSGVSVWLILKFSGENDMLNLGWPIWSSL